MTVKIRRIRKLRQKDPTVTPAPDDTAKDDPAADDTNQDDTNQDNQNGTGNDASSDQWKQDENLDDLVKDEIQKENETVKNFDEISNPSGTDSTEDGYLISDVSFDPAGGSKSVRKPCIRGADGNSRS